MDDEYEALRKKRIAALQEQAQREYQEQRQAESQFKEQLDQLESFVKPYLTKEALSRYGTVKSAHLENAVQALVIAAQLINSGKIKSIDDNAFKALLQQVQPKRRDITITRK